MRKKSLAVLLTLVMLLGLSPATALADEPGTEEPAEKVVYAIDIPAAATFLSSGIALLSEGTGVTISPSSIPNAEKWVDRLDWTGHEYAKVFYDALEDAVDGTTANWLADPSVSSVPNVTDLGTYYLGVIEDNQEVTYEVKVESGRQYTITGTGNDLTTAVAYITAAYMAFDRDRPEVFWLEGGVRFLGGTDSMSFILQEKSTRQKVTWNGTGYEPVDPGTQPETYQDYDLRKGDYQNTDTLKQAIEDRDAAITGILTEGNSVSWQSETLTYAADSDDYAKARYFNAWLTKNNGYNTNLGNAPKTAWECVSALTGQAGPDGPVCEGYARAFKVLCDKVGIPCVLLDGQAGSTPEGAKGPHMWNYVKMEDGQWYGVDVTWNDSNPSAIQNSGSENETYLLKGSSVFAEETRTIENSPP